MKRIVLTSALLLLGCVAAFGQAEESGADDSVMLRLDPQAGSYEEDVLLEVGSDVTDARLRYRIAGPGSSELTPYDGPIELSALPGERRAYRIVIRAERGGELLEEREATYVVDRRRPAPPSISVLSGYYESARDVGFEAADGAEVYYALEGPEFVRWDGTPLALEGESGRRVEYLLEAYARHDEGPRSRVVSKRIVIDRDVREPESLEIESPIAGDWANPQLLYVKPAGFRTIRYTTDGSDPRNGGRTYDGPVVLEAEGEVTLRVYGRTGSGRELTDRVTFRQGASDLLSVEQGRRTADFEVRPPDDGVYRVRRGAEGASSLFSQPVALSVQRGSLRGAELHVEGPFDRQEETGRLRYFFLLDGRIPTPPDVIVDTRGQEALVTMTGSRGARVRYEVTAAGRTVSEGIYEAPVDVALPAGTDGGELRVSARTSYDAERVSEATTVRRSFDTAAPAAARLRSNTQGPRRQVALDIAAPDDARVLYELSFSGGAAEPGRFSAELETGGAPPVLSVPRGVSAVATLRLRAADAAGNLSPPSEEYRLQLDHRPPPEPRIILDRNVARISGSGELYYSVEPGLDDDLGFRPVEGPLLLAGESQERVEYRIEAYAVDPVGNRSSVTTARHIVDRRIPRVPDTLTVTDGASYARPVVTAQLFGGPEDLLLHYTVTTDGTEPAEPTADSAVLPSEGLRFEAESGEELPVRLKLLPRFRGATVTGRLREVAFRVDRRAPDTPVVSGIEPGGAYASARLLEIRPADADDEVVVEVTETAADREPTVTRFLYSEPLPLHGAPGRETLYEIRLTARDAAGNETTVPEPIRVLIDRSPPDATAPRISGVADTSMFGMLSNGPVRLEPPADGSIRFEMTDDGSAPAPVGRESDRLVEAATLSGREGGEVLYRVSYRSEDAAGNLSEEAGTLAFVVDRRAPPAPSEPSVRVSEDGRSARLAWPQSPGVRTGYRLLDGGSAEEGAFRRADESVDISFPRDSSSVTVEAVRVDAAGNRSETASFEVNGFTVSAAPVLAGVEPGAVYGSTVVLENRSEDATVRYEVAAGDEEPDPPTRFSEVLPPRLPFDVSPGETLRYTVRARAFGGDARPSEEVRLSFTVDRTAPPPPQLADARSGDFYTGSRAVELTAPEGEIRYRLALVDEEAGEFRSYRSSVRLEALPGELAHYRLEAFTVDAAGNRSGAPRVWDLYIDQEIVYVSADAPQEADGSRRAPFSELSRAVEFALARDRRTIFVSTGTYELSEPLRITGDLTVQGGLEAETWRRADEGTSEIRLEGAGGGAALFEVEGSSLTLERLELFAREALVLRALDARVFMQGLTLRAEGGPALLSASESDIEGRNLELAAGGLSGEAAVRLRGGGTSFESVTVEAGGDAGDFAVVGSDGADVRLAGTTLRTGEGRRTSAVRANGGSVRIFDSEVHAGPAADASEVVRARNAEVLIRDSVLVSSRDAGIGTVVSTDGGTLTLQGSSLEVAGRRGASGVFARGTRVSISRNAFRAGEADQFLHVMSMRDVTGTVDTNLVIGGRSRELIVGRLVGSDTAWYNNTIRGGAGSRFTQAFNIDGASRTRLVNNVLFHAAEGTGTAVYAGEDGSGLEIAANAFSGWDMVYRESSDGRRWSPPGGDDASGARTAGDLNARAGLDARGNLDLPDREAFTDDVHLSPDAPLIDAGVFPGADGPSVDWDGQERPQRGQGTYDIGADEYFG